MCGSWRTHMHNSRARLVSPRVFLSSPHSFRQQAAKADQPVTPLHLLETPGTQSTSTVSTVIVCKPPSALRRKSDDVRMTQLFVFTHNAGTHSARPARSPSSTQEGNESCVDVACRSRYVQTHGWPGVPTSSSCLSKTRAAKHQQQQDSKNTSSTTA